MDEAVWRDWAAERASELGVPEEARQFDELLDLTRMIAHRFERPAGPLACYLAGYALAKGEAGDLTEIIAQIEKTLPKEKK